MGRSDVVPVLYVDDEMVVVDKPERMLVVEAPGRKGATVVDVVGRQLGGSVFAVHRLDEDTTGVLVLARTAEARRGLEETFRGHRAERVYLAVAERVPSPVAGRIESRLREDADGIVVSSAGGKGRLAVTEYRMVARVREGAVLECRPQTGRRNQIRVHLAELGCAIVGDRKYGSRRRARGRRLMLHAWRLELEQPRTGALLRIEAPIPKEFPSW